MDGTLIDSMSHHAAAWRRMTLEQGLDIPAEEFYLYEGMTGRATIKMLWEREKGFAPDDSRCDELYALKARYFSEMPKVDVILGAERMLKILMAHGVERVLVTGSKQRSNLDRLDDDFPGAFPHHLRITAADVVNGKPHPEPYLRAMELVGATPSECIVIENAPLGVQAGAASGALTLAAATGPIPVETLTAAGAAHAFPSMEHLADWLGDYLSGSSH